MPKEKKYTDSDFTFELLDKEDSNRKLGEALLYISKKCQNDERFGMTKLNKTLYFSDFLYYAKTGKGITGGRYMKLVNGPVPHQMKPVIERMKQRGFEVIIYTYFDRNRKSKFSTSNYLLKTASRWVKLTKDNFE